MPIDSNDVTKIFGTDGAVKTPSNATDFEKNPMRSAGESLTNGEFYARAAAASAADALSAVKTMAATVTAQSRQIDSLTATVAKLQTGGGTVDVPALVKAINDDAAQRLRQ